MNSRVSLLRVKTSKAHKEHMLSALPRIADVGLCYGRCPTQGWSPSDRQKNRHTQHGKVWREKTSALRMLAALASSPAAKALDPDLSPATHSAMPSMLPCCTSDLKRRLFSRGFLLARSSASTPRARLRGHRVETVCASPLWKLKPSRISLSANCTDKAIT